MGCSLPDSSVHGIFQTRILEYGAISFSRGSSWPRDQTCVSCIGRQVLYHWATWEAWRTLCCCCSVAQSSPTLHDLMDCSMTGIPVLHHLSELAQIHVHWVSDAKKLILYRPLILLPSIFPSIRVLSNESALHIRWPKYWSFSISPSNECSGLISFRMDWLHLLGVQGTLKSLLQHHGLKASILHGPTLISLHDYWKNHSFDYTLLFLFRLAIFSLFPPIPLTYLFILGSKFCFLPIDSQVLILILLWNYCQILISSKNL